METSGMFVHVVLQWIQGVFLPLVQCSRDKLWIHHHLDQNKAVTEEKNKQTNENYIQNNNR